MSWLPVDFVAPARVDLEGHHPRPIHPDYTDLDVFAVMGSQERLWSICGAAWGWPPAHMTAEADRADLVGHADEMRRNELFDDALFDRDETRLLGCVYVDPPERGAADVEISWWVVDELTGSDVACELDTLVPRVISDHWPFERPRYLGIALTRADWLALPEP